jgi:hypothetical protein
LKIQKEILSAQKELLESRVAAQKEVQDAQKESLESRVAQARAESIKECNEKFLIYGCAAEYQKLQQKMTSHKSLESSQSAAIIV